MSFTHAGYYIEALQDDRGNALKIEVFTLTDPANGNAAVTTYTDATKATTHTGTLYTDPYGNAAFYADPGIYTLTVPRTGKSFPVQVTVNAADINTTVDPSVMHKTGTETVTGAKDFTGGITKNGTAVATTTDVSTAQTAAQSYTDAAVATALAGLSPAQGPAAAQGSGITHSGIGQTVGGVTITAGMRVLDTANSASAGLWVTASGAWTRPTDFAHGSNAQGKLVEVNNGGVWVCIGTGPVTIDTTSQVWVEIDASVIQAGTGLSKSGNTLNLALTKALITATGLTYSDVNADQSGAAAAAQAASRARWNTIATAKTASYTAAINDSATFDTTSGAISQALEAAARIGDI